MPSLALILLTLGIALTQISGCSAYANQRVDRIFEKNLGYTPLMNAVRKGDAAEVKKLIAQGVDLNARDNGGDTPLHRAFFFKHPDIARLLIDAGADVNARNNQGMTPLMLAAMFADAETVRQLLAKGADPNAKDNLGKLTALDYAISTGNPGVSQVLLAKVNKPAQNNLTMAIFRNQEEMLASLLDKGADVNQKAPDGATPLLLAAFCGNPRIVQMLLDRGAQVNAATLPSSKMDAYCMKLGQMDMGTSGAPQRDRLTRMQDNLDKLEDYKGITYPGSMTPLLFAIWEGHYQAAEVLLAHGAQVNARNTLGRTPLMLAASSSGGTEMVRSLLSRGAEVDAEDKEGTTAAGYAWEGDYLETLRLLETRAAKHQVSGTIAGLDGIIYAGTDRMHVAISSGHHLEGLALGRFPALVSLSLDAPGKVFYLGDVEEAASRGWVRYNKAPFYLAIIYFTNPFGDYQNVENLIQKPLLSFVEYYLTKMAPLLRKSSLILYYYRLNNML